MDCVREQIKTGDHFEAKLLDNGDTSPSNVHPYSNSLKNARPLHDSNVENNFELGWGLLVSGDVI